MRDREGILQIVFDPAEHPDTHREAEKLRDEYVVMVKGKVVKRPEGTVNKELATGEIEIRASSLHILNTSRSLPFSLDDNIDVAEEVRLKYRYLDLRRAQMQKNFIKRYRIAKSVRNFLDSCGFIEIETPFLTKSTPEGARDYLVPSRMYPGKFFALPQSPQLFKQILMVAGYERYFQLVRCFRDEDLRADRQPEHTQIDIEMSFIDELDIESLAENLMAEIFKEVLGKKLQVPFLKIGYADALMRFGSDKPDTRFGMEIIDATDIFKTTQFKVFADAVASAGVIRGIRVEGGASFSAKKLDEIIEEAVKSGAKGLIWIKAKNNDITSPVAKYISDAEKKKTYSFIWRKGKRPDFAHRGQTFCCCILSRKTEALPWRPDATYR
jgi:aspartyl-tRNA synthetase